jgi:hypothetical protein
MSLIVVMTNISKLAPISDYNYEVLVGDGTVSGSQTIVRGRITGHERDAGWQALVGRVLDQHRTAETETP